MQSVHAVIDLRYELYAMQCAYVRMWPVALDSSSTAGPRLVAAAAARWLKATTATDSRAARGDAEGGELESPVVEGDAEGETMKTMGRARWRVGSRSLQVETFLRWCLPLL